MEHLIAKLSLNNNIVPTQNEVKERITRFGEQSTLNLLINISHCLIKKLPTFIINKEKN